MNSPKLPQRMYPAIVDSSLKSTSPNLPKLILKPKPTGHWRWMQPLRPKHWNWLEVHGPSKHAVGWTQRLQAEQNSASRQYSNRSVRTGCTGQHHSPMRYRPATAPSWPLIALSKNVLTQHPLWQTWSPTSATANPTESTPDNVQMSEATSLACYWLFRKPKVFPHWYQRGRALLAPFSTKRGPTWSPRCDLAVVRHGNQKDHRLS